MEDGGVGSGERLLDEPRHRAGRAHQRRGRLRRRRQCIRRGFNFAFVASFRVVSFRIFRLIRRGLLGGTRGSRAEVPAGRDRGEREVQLRVHRREPRLDLLHHVLLRRRRRVRMKKSGGGGGDGAAGVVHRRRGGGVRGSSRARGCRRGDTGIAAVAVERDVRSLGGHLELRRRRRGQGGRFGTRGCHGRTGRVRELDPGRRRNGEGCRLRRRHDFLRAGVGVLALLAAAEGEGRARGVPGVFRVEREVRRDDVWGPRRERGSSARARGVAADAFGAGRHRGHVLHVLRGVRGGDVEGWGPRRLRLRVGHDAAVGAQHGLVGGGDHAHLVALGVRSSVLRRGRGGGYARW